MILNRGNHEDFAIFTVYGFQLECAEKYGEVIFGMFVEIFQVRWWEGSAGVRVSVCERDSVRE